MDKNQIFITAKADSTTSGEIMIYGNIVDRKWYSEDDGVTAKDFDKAIKDLGKGLKDLTVRVNSYGGSVFAGQAIATMMDTARAKGVKITAVIEGIGASMGSVIPQAADKVRMASNAMMMVHKPSAFAWGNADDMQKTIEMLDKAEKTLLGLYMRRFTGTEDELKDLLAAETWLTADEALGYGLCDEVDEPVELAACAGGYMVNGINVPAAVLNGAADKIQIFATEKGGEKEMIFDKETDAKILAMIEEGKAVAIEKNESGFVVTEVFQAQLDSTVDFLTAEQVQEETGLEDVGPDIVLCALKSLVEAGIDITDVESGLNMLKTPDPELVGKAAAYDNFLETVKSEAYKNGVRAMGADKFKQELWEKTFAHWTLEEIQGQSTSWMEDAEKKFHAGRGRLSQDPGEPANIYRANPDDCKFV